MFFALILLVFLEEVVDFSSDSSSRFDLLVLLEVHTRLILSVHGQSAVGDALEIFIIGGFIVGARILHVGIVVLGL